MCVATARPWSQDRSLERCVTNSPSTNGRPSDRYCRTRREACPEWMIDVSSTAIFWVLGSGAPWRDLPECYGPYTTCYNRFVRWRGELAYGGRPFHQSGLLAPAGAGLSLNNEDAQAKACRDRFRGLANEWPRFTAGPSVLVVVSTRPGPTVSIAIPLKLFTQVYSGSRYQSRASIFHRPFPKRPHTYQPSPVVCRP